VGVSTATGISLAARHPPARPQATRRVSSGNFGKSAMASINYRICSIGVVYFRVFPFCFFLSQTQSIVERFGGVNFRPRAPYAAQRVAVRAEPGSIQNQ